MGENIHRNHIVPQFYLSLWGNKQQCLYTYDMIHKSYGEKSTDSIGWIKDTYSDDLETALANFENNIAEPYRKIIQKLEKSPYKNNLRDNEPLLNADEQRIIFQFLYVQSVRTLTGRINMSPNKNGLYSVNETIMSAEQQNTQLLQIIQNIDNIDIYQNALGCYWIIYRMPKCSYFCTSTNPVCYISFKDILAPINIFQKQPDTQAFPLSPRLLLCITQFKPTNSRLFRRNFMYLMPLDKLLSGFFTGLHEKDKLVTGINFNLLAGFEPQVFAPNRHDNSIDVRNTAYFIISKVPFNDNDKLALGSVNVGARDDG